MKKEKFHKILVANRGEIAVRIIKAIQELDKLAVVIHSEYDKELPFVTLADEAFSLGQGGLAETYLNIEKILAIAVRAKVDAIHPGYGFLSESAAFASACKKAGIQFIGPEAEVINLMGHKSNARQTAEDLGVPVLKGYRGNIETLLKNKNKYPYPLLVKPSEGGGGKGMKIARSSEELELALKDAVREAESFFGSGEVYLESYIDHPRHIEIQVIADFHGNSAHLYERECSLQRRYQKIIEEAPSEFLTPEKRGELTDSALKLIKGINYTNAGTIEFLVDENQNFYFLEMNTRIQVEHPVTEMITGIDLVKEQITIAEGAPLSFSQQEVKVKGHAMEARIYAEDPEREFMPSTGRIDTLDQPKNYSLRIDSGYGQGNLVEPWYDPMIAKVIAFGSNRIDARNHLISALKEYRITGLTTNRDFLIELLRSDDLADNRIDTKYIDRELSSILSVNEKARKEWPVETLLSVSALISLRDSFHGNDTTLSPWHNIGYWRMLPEILLKFEQKQFRIGYELKKGRNRILLHIEGNLFDVSLERELDNHFWIRINNQSIMVWGVADRSDIFIDLDGHLFRIRRMDILDNRYLERVGKISEEINSKEIIAPLHGKIVQINVKEGGKVSKGDTVLIIESMKMENKIIAPSDLTIEKIHYSVGEQVEINKLLVTLK